MLSRQQVVQYSYGTKYLWFGFPVNKNAENYDYAVEFIRFLARKDELNTMANIKGIPSVAGEYASEKDALKDFVSMCKQ